MILPDSLTPNLDIVFCGTAASTISAREVAYYANPTNYFWRTLHSVGLTPYQLPPKSFPELLQYGIGLTDLAKSAKGNDSDLVASDFDREALQIKIETFQPKILAFTSKKGASVFLQTSTGQLKYGQLSQTIQQTKIWVLPSPSGAARRYWDETIWQALANNVNCSLCNQERK